MLFFEIMDTCLLTRRSWRVIFEIAGFVLCFDTQFSDPFHANFLFVMFVTINCKKEIGYETAKYLCHESVFGSCDKVINFEMAFPPAEKDFNVPSELIHRCYLFSREVVSVCGNPVHLIINAVANYPQFLRCLVEFGSA